MKKTIWLALFKNIVPSDFENMMESLALEGWHIGKIKQFNAIKMSFYKTAPKKYRYIFDANTLLNENFCNTYEQLGWEFMGQMASYVVWRKEYTSIRPESFMDARRLQSRNNKVRNALLFLLILIFLGILALVISGIICSHLGYRKKSVWLFGEAILLSIISCYFIWAVKKTSCKT